MEGCGLHLIMVAWAHPSRQPKQHLDPFSHFFAGLTSVTDELDRPTDRSIDHVTQSVTTGRIYVCSTCNGEALKTSGHAGDAGDAGETVECFGGRRRRAVKRAIFELFCSGKKRTILLCIYSTTL